MPRLVYIITSSMSADRLLRGQLRFMQEQGFDVFLISAPGPGLQTAAGREGIETISVPMRREISPWNDFKALLQIYSLLRRLKPDIVNAGTPKAGLLGTAAAWAAGVPVRIYMQRGLRLETVRGPMRVLLWLLEKLTAACATRVIVVSESLRRTYLHLRLCRPEKTVVLGCGSSNGVDPARFSRSGETRLEAGQLRSLYEIRPAERVVGFVGRLTRDKGIEDLISAFELVSSTHEACRLLLLGEVETEDGLPPHVIQRLESNPKVTLCPPADDSAPYYFLFDILALPSYREGFSNAVLEAAAAALPVVAYSATGMDAVVDGMTGTLVEVGNVPAFADALADYLEQPERRLKHGAAGLERVHQFYLCEAVWRALLDEYRRLLGIRPDHPSTPPSEHDGAHAQDVPSSPDAEAG